MKITERRKQFGENLEGITVCYTDTSIKMYVKNIKWL